MWCCILSVSASTTVRELMLAKHGVITVYLLAHVCEVIPEGRQMGDSVTGALLC